jgi:hypothetical protein
MVAPKKLSLEYPNVSEFKDYRDYLKKVISLAKTQKPQTMTLTKIAKKVGLSAPYLTMTLKKQRNISLEAVSGICKILFVPQTSSEELTFLYLANNTHESTLRRRFKTIFDTIHREHSDLHVMKPKTFFEK